MTGRRRRRREETHEGVTESPQTSQPSRTTYSTESPHRSHLLASPRRSLSSPETPPHPPQRCSTEGPRARYTCPFEPVTPASSSPHRPACSSATDQGCGCPDPQTRVCWTGRGRGEETGASRRYQQAAPMGALGGVSDTAWFACLGFLRHPLVSFLPPPSSSSGHDSPLERCAPLRLFGRGAVLGHGSFLNGVSLRDPVKKKLPRPAGLRSQAHSTTLTRSTGALKRPELAFAREGQGGSRGVDEVYYRGPSLRDHKGRAADHRGP